MASTQKKNLHAEYCIRQLSPEMHQVPQFPFSAKTVYNLSSDRYKDLTAYCVLRTEKVIDSFSNRILHSDSN